MFGKIWFNAHDGTRKQDTCRLNEYQSCKFSCNNYSDNYLLYNLQSNNLSFEALNLSME